MEKGEIDMKQRYDKKISNTYYPKMAEAQNDGIIFYSLMFPKIAVKSSINQDDKIEIEFINANKIEEIIKGDINGDGVFDIVELTILNKHLIETQRIIDSKWLIAADLNKDGKIDIVDLSILNKKINK